MTTTWNPIRVAQRVLELAQEHGVPNRFQLTEVVGQGGKTEVLAVSRIARLQDVEVNRLLQAEHLHPRYQSRQGSTSPACITVAGLDG